MKRLFADPFSCIETYSYTTFLGICIIIKEVKKINL